MPGDEKKAYPRSLEGHFLISEVNLADPHFQHTVVLMVNHDENGALGLVVNRRLDVTLGDVIPDFEGTEPGKLPIYQGGPVQPEYLFTIHSGLPRNLRTEQATTPIEQVTFEPGFQILVDYLKGAWASLPSSDRPPVHLYAGYAGWSSGQLERELSAGAWIVRPAAAKHIFRADPEEGWREALGELGGLYKIVADTDFKPSMN
jgi:putative transcriptional regulator